MKFVMSERVKHRLTGIVVIISVAVIFLPAMMKNSSLHFDENIRASLKLPPKPLQPKVVIPKQTAMLKTVKVAHVKLPAVINESHPAIIAKAESLSKSPPSVLVKVEMPLTSVIASAVIPATSVATAEAGLKNGYGIQLASFTQQSNAEYLVARLRKQGYVANYNIYKGKKGQFYQVVAGMVSKKDDAINLQKKLATNMQLNGYIIKTGIS